MEAKGIVLMCEPRFIGDSSLLRIQCNGAQLHKLDYNIYHQNTSETEKHLHLHQVLNSFIVYKNMRSAHYTQLYE